MRSVAVLIVLAVALTSGPGWATTLEWNEQRFLEYRQRFLDGDDARFQKLGFEDIRTVQQSGRETRRVYLDNDWFGTFGMQAELKPDGSVSLRAMIWNQALPEVPASRAAWDTLLPLEERGFRMSRFKPVDPNAAQQPPIPVCHGDHYYVGSTGAEGIRQAFWLCYDSGDPEVLGVYEYGAALVNLTLAAHGCETSETPSFALEPCFPWHGPS